MSSHLNTEKNEERLSIAKLLRHHSLEGLLLSGGQVRNLNAHPFVQAGGAAERDEKPARAAAPRPVPVGGVPARQAAQRALPSFVPGDALQPSAASAAPGSWPAWLHLSLPALRERLAMPRAGLRAVGGQFPVDFLGLDFFSLSVIFA